MGCSHQEWRGDEIFCKPKNMRCVNVPGSECRELYEAQKEESKKDGGSE